MTCSKLRMAWCLGLAGSLLACGGQHLGEDPPDLPDAVKSNADCQGAAYATGPFGKMEGSTILNHCFETSEGDYLSLASFHNDPSARLLLVTTSAGWCSACIEEQPYLQQWFTDLEATGFRVLVTLFEDESLVPATREYASDWKSRFNLTFPVVADPAVFFSGLGASQPQMGWYYDTKLAPMQMLIDTQSMRILSLDVGASTDTLFAKIQGFL